MNLYSVKIGYPMHSTIVTMAENEERARETFEDIISDSIHENYKRDYEYPQIAHSTIWRIRDEIKIIEHNINFAVIIHEDR